MALSVCVRACAFVGTFEMKKIDKCADCFKMNQKSPSIEIKGSNVFELETTTTTNQSIF